MTGRAATTRFRSRNSSNSAEKHGSTKANNQLPLTHQWENRLAKYWNVRQRKGKSFHTPIVRILLLFKWMHRNNLQWILFFCTLVYFGFSMTEREKNESENVFLDVGAYAFSVPYTISHSQSVLLFWGQQTQRISVLSIENNQIRERPRNIGLYLQEMREDEEDLYMILVGTERLYPPMNHSPLSGTREIYVTRFERIMQKILLDSEEYGPHEHFPPECDFIHEWQYTIHPTCNTFHETTLGNLNPDSHHGGENMVRIVSIGGYIQDVWMTREYDGAETHVTKTLKLDNDGDNPFSLSRIEGQQQDAMCMERLTASPHIMNIYGFCGSSAMHELSKEPPLYDQLFSKERSREFNMTYKVQMAQQVASGLADMHFTEGDDQLPTISHSDIATDQFLFTDNGRRLKLNDFNRGEMLRWNKTTGKLCGYVVNFNGGRNRSPEEYLYRPQTDKIDVYSMGNVFYSLLTEERPFEELAESRDEWIGIVTNGGWPNLNHPAIVSQKDNNPLVQLLLEAMDMCWTFNPEERPNSRQVEAFLTKKMKELGVPIL